MITRFLGASIVLLLACLPGRAQQLIQNGSFETPVETPFSVLGLGLVPGFGTFVDAGSPNNGITDWSVTQGTVTLLNNGGTVVDNLGLLSPPDGNQYAILNSLSISGLGIITVGGLGTLQQTFSTTAGNTYQVSFVYGGLAVSAVNGTAALQVNVSNSSSSTAPNSGLINISASGFQTETFDFVATGSSSTLSFDEPSGSLAHADGVGLDNVTVNNEGIQPVPEPAQWAGAAVGFLGLLAGGRLLMRRFEQDGTPTAAA